MELKVNLGNVLNPIFIAEKKELKSNPLIQISIFQPGHFKTWSFSRFNTWSSSLPHIYQ
jgi:hypothetical protein